LDSLVECEDCRCQYETYNNCLHVFDPVIRLLHELVHGFIYDIHRFLTVSLIKSTIFAMYSFQLTVINYIGIHPFIHNECCALIITKALRSNKRIRVF
jgi:hypothetical protein